MRGKRGDNPLHGRRRNPGTPKAAASGRGAHRRQPEADGGGGGGSAAQAVEQYARSLAALAQLLACPLKTLERYSAEKVIEPASATEGGGRRWPVIASAARIIEYKSKHTVAESEAEIAALKKKAEARIKVAEATVKELDAAVKTGGWMRKAEAEAEMAAQAIAFSGVLERVPSELADKSSEQLSSWVAARMKELSE